MLSLALVLSVAAALGLAFPDTRWLGVLCAALLGWFLPVPVTAFLLLAGIAFLFFHWR